MGKGRQKSALRVGWAGPGPLDRQPQPPGKARQVDHRPPGSPRQEGAAPREESGEGLSRAKQEETGQAPCAPAVWPCPRLCPYPDLCFLCIKAATVCELSVSYMVRFSARTGCCYALSSAHSGGLHSAGRGRPQGELGLEPGSLTAELRPAQLHRADSLGGGRAQTEASGLRGARGRDPDHEGVLSGPRSPDSTEGV